MANVKWISKCLNVQSNFVVNPKDDAVKQYKAVRTAERYTIIENSRNLSLGENGCLSRRASNAGEEYACRVIYDITVYGVTPRRLWGIMYGFFPPC